MNLSAPIKQSIQLQKILILTAIPHGLRLDKETREIEDAIRRATRRDLFDIRTRTAVRPQDIRRTIAEEKPHIVHFCGHGLKDGSLLLEDDGGNNKPVPPQGLATLFKHHSDYVRCVLLNACHSVTTADAISEHINYAIGMNQEIGDRAAIAFAQGFYDGLGYDSADNQDVFVKAFNEGLTALILEDISQESIPVMKKTLNENPVPELDTHISNIYIERHPGEERCYHNILQPGVLIRIKAPQKMGKTWLLNNLLSFTRKQGYQTVKLDLQQAENSVFENLKTFLQWLCVDVSDSLDIEPQVDQIWQYIYGVNKNCTRYFQKVLLSVNETPLVLAIDNFERLLEYPDIFSQFCLLLRGWYEKAKGGDRVAKIWEKLRLVVVHSTEDYPSLDTNHSPFNVGIAIELPEFNQEQVKAFAAKYELDQQLGEENLIKLMGLIGGHPYLLQQAFIDLKSQQMNLEQLFTLAPTEEGIFSDYLRKQLWQLQHNSQLELGYKKVIMANAPVRLDAEVAFKLHSLGLVKLSGNDCVPSCDLYRQYFSQRLG